MKTADKLKTARIGHGLRERLLLSFIAISGFAVVAALVGNYAFYAIGQSLHQVTEKSVPPAIATLELAQRAERIIAAGPALLGVTTPEEFKTASSALGRELEAAERLLAQLPDQGLSFPELAEINGVYDRVTANLKSLQLAVQARNAAADRRSALVRDTIEAYNQFRTLWTPKFNELKGHILALQRTLDDPRSTPEEKLAAFNRLNAAVGDLTPLEQIQQEAAIAFEALVRAGSAATPADLDAIRVQAEAAVRRIDDLVSGLDPDVSFALIVPLSRLRNNAIGSASIIAARQVELNAAQEGRRLTVENADLSVQLSSAVEFPCRRVEAGHRDGDRTDAIGPRPRPAWPGRGRRAQPDQLGPDRMALCRPQRGGASDHVVGWHARPRRRPARHRNPDQRQRRDHRHGARRRGVSRQRHCARWAFGGARTSGHQARKNSGRADRRALRGAGAADGNLGGAASHLKFVDRTASCFRRHPEQCLAHLRRQVWDFISSRRRWRPRGGIPQCATGLLRATQGRSDTPTTAGLRECTRPCDEASSPN